MNFLNFTYKTEQNIRVVVIENEPWFVAKDVAKVLGYVDTDQAIRKHVEKEDKLTRQFNGSGQNREMVIINQYAVYDLALSSKLEGAKQFKKWLTHEVIPSIEKTGQYIDSENKFEELCPVKFGKDELKKEMGRRIKNLGGQKKGGLAYYYAYDKYGKMIGFDFYHYAKSININPIDWLKQNDHYEEFCELVCTHKI